MLPPPSSGPDNHSRSPRPKQGLSIGAIAGIAALASLYFCIRRRQKHYKQPPPRSLYQQPDQFNAATHSRLFLGQLTVPAAPPFRVRPSPMLRPSGTSPDISFHPIFFLTSHSIPSFNYTMSRGMLIHSRRSNPNIFGSSQSRPRAPDRASESPRDSSLNNPNQSKCTNSANANQLFLKKTLVFGGSNGPLKTPVGKRYPVYFTGPKNQPNQNQTKTKPKPNPLIKAKSASFPNSPYVSSPPSSPSPPQPCTPPPPSSPPPATAATACTH